MGGITCLSPDPRGGMWLGDARTAGALGEGGDSCRSCRRPAAPAERILVRAPTTRPAGCGSAIRARGSGCWRASRSACSRPETFGAGGRRPSSASPSTRTDAIWVTTNAGLSRFAGGRFTTITRANGLPASRASSIVEDADHDLWVSLERRHHPDRARRRSTRWRPTRAHRIRYQFYDASDGLAGAPHPERPIRPRRGRQAVVRPRRRADHRRPARDPPVAVDPAATGAHRERPPPTSAASSAGEPLEVPAGSQARGHRLHGGGADAAQPRALPLPARRLRHRVG